MSHESDEVIFEASEPLDGPALTTAVIHCSDGRIGNQCEEFASRALELVRYDRIVVPGGPASLAGHFAAYRQGNSLEEQLKFLIDAHNLQRVVLIGHEDCAFYSQVLKVTGVKLREQQYDDLRKAAQRISDLNTNLQVEIYFAALTNGRINFHRVG